MALVGISSVTSLIIGLVLYYFAQDRLVHAENTLLKQRSRTANAGAQDFLEGLRDPEDQTLPPPPTTPRNSSGRSPTRRASRCSTWDPTWNPWPPVTASGIPSTRGKPTGGLDKAKLEGGRLVAGGRGQARVERGTLGLRGGVAAHGHDGTVEGRLGLRRSPGRARGDAGLPALRHPRGHTDERPARRGGEPAPHAPGHAPPLRDQGRGHKGRLRGLRGDRACQEQGRARRGRPDLQLHGRGDRALRRGDPGAKEPPGGRSRGLSRGCRRHGPRRAGDDGQPRGGQDARHQGL